MKKTLLAFIMVFSLVAPVWADSQAPEAKPIPVAPGAVVGTAARITFIFYDGKVAETEVSESRYETADESIQKKLKRLWEQGGIKQITHVNGKPIDQTKWAEYGGQIPKGGEIPGGTGGTSAPGTVTPPGSSGTSPGTNTPGATPKPNQQQKPPAVKIPNKITVVVDHEPVYFEDYDNVMPFIKNSRTLVPMRAVFEHFNVQATVKWDQATRTVTATNQEGKKIIFTIDKSEYQVVYPGGRVEKKINDVPPIIHQSRTMLPLRALGESLGFKVSWWDQTKVVEMEAQGNYRGHLLDKKVWEETVTKFNQGDGCQCSN